MTKTATTTFTGNYGEIDVDASGLARRDAEAGDDEGARLMRLTFDRIDNVLYAMADARA